VLSKIWLQKPSNLLGIRTPSGGMKINEQWKDNFERKTPRSKNTIHMLVRRSAYSLYVATWRGRDEQGNESYFTDSELIDSGTLRSWTGVKDLPEEFVLIFSKMPFPHSIKMHCEIRPDKVKTGITFWYAEFATRQIDVGWEKRKMVWCWESMLGNFHRVFENLFKVERNKVSIWHVGWIPTTHGVCNRPLDVRGDRCGWCNRRIDSHYVNDGCPAMKEER
jgi:hypothetical protein